MTLFTVLNGAPKLLIRSWIPFCSNQGCGGGVAGGSTKI